jgi:hypothetical protein
MEQRFAAGEDRYPFVDLALSRRLERAEARSNRDFVEARAALQPQSGACWIEVAGAYAMYDGVASPCTQTFGLGVFDKPSDADMALLEDFFAKRGAAVDHEVSPLADPGLLAMLNERGYQPIELTSVMFRPIHRRLDLAAPRNERIQVYRIRDDQGDLWTRTALAGWKVEAREFADLMLDLCRVNASRPGTCWLAELDGQAIASGGAIIGDGVILLAGASTIPEARKQGAQLALLEARLRAGAEAGCDLAMMCAAPGSSSQRNAERHGFRIAYTRIKWRLARKQ